MVNQVKLVGQIGALVVVFALILFLAAGTGGWASGWLFLALFFGFVIVLSDWLARTNPALLSERMNGTMRDQQRQDTLVLLIINVLFLAWLVVMPLDAVRFRWSVVPVWVQGVGVVLLLAAFACFFLTFRENTYLSPSVRVQTERGQTVIATGPYHYVRHPMYSGFLLFMVRYRAVARFVVWAAGGNRVAAHSCAARGAGGTPAAGGATGLRPLHHRGALPPHPARLVSRAHDKR